MRRLFAIAAILCLLPASAALAQSKTQVAGITIDAIESTARAQSIALSETDPSHRQSVLHALRMIRADLSTASPELAFSKNSSATGPSDDSTDADFGGIAGFVYGAIDTGWVDPTGNAADAWVLAVAVDLADNPTAWQTTSVNDDGSYVFSRLYPGAYILMAGATLSQPQFFPQVYSIEEAHPVDVVPGLLVEGIDFFLEPILNGEGAISGTVRAASDNSTLPDAEVQGYAIGSPYRFLTATADENGTYVLSGAPEGRYVVYASAEGYFGRFYDDTANRSDATPVEVRADSTTHGIDFALPRSGSISGSVTNSDGTPIVGVDVFVHTDPRGPDPDSTIFLYSGWTTTDTDGVYSISGIPSGEFYVQVQTFNDWYVVSEWYDDAQRFEDATPVAVTEGEETSGIDFALDLNYASGAISGQVSSANGFPVVNTFLHLERYDSTGDSLDYYIYIYTEADPDGNYRFENVPVGSYRVSMEYWGGAFYPTVWYDQVFNREDATAVVVEQDQTTENINFQLVPAEGVIEGTVTDSDGKPVANANVFASSGEYFYPIDLATGYGYAHAVTDVNGQYRISGLIDGEYFVNASACMFWHCVERWWPDAASFADAEPVVVTDGHSTPSAIDLTLPFAQGTSTLSGTVQHVDGNALAGAMVAVSLTSDAHIADDSLFWNVETQAFTDSSGFYSFYNLPEGDYTASASYWDSAGFAVQWFDGADSPDAATVISLADGDVRDDIDFLLEPKPSTGRLTGSVFLDDSSFVSRAFVEVTPFYWDYSSSIIEPVPYHAVTDINGVFEISHLPVGSYYVNVYAQGARVLDVTGDPQYAIEIEGGESTYINVMLVRTEEGPGSISGSVLSSAGDVPDIAVVLAIVDDDPLRMFTAITDADGNYELNGLAPGEYVLWSFAPYHMTEYYDNVFDPADATRIRLEDDGTGGDRQTGVNFALDVIYFFGPDDQWNENTAFVFGKVSDSDGAAIADASVYAMNLEGEIVHSVRTHADGMFEIVGLAPGNGIRIKATHAGYTSRFHDGSESFESTGDLVLSSGRFEINISLATAVSTGSDNDRSRLTEGISFLGNYPNPFETETTINFTLSAPLAVTVTIYDVLGRQVTEFDRGTLSAGEHKVRWGTRSNSGGPTTSGVYFYRISAGEYNQTGQMMVVR